MNIGSVDKQCFHRSESQMELYIMKYFNFFFVRQELAVSDDIHPLELCHANIISYLGHQLKRESCIQVPHPVP